MAIKVTLGEAKPQEVKPFPKLMVATKEGATDEGIIVLFNDNCIGTVIKTVDSSDKHIGFHSVTFIMKCFTDYNEPITLQNQ